ncbi:DMT family transporter [Methylobrevis pamukkalensis]|nr:DMT family transporter [Methylobrevis pamukkalensis]
MTDLAATGSAGSPPPRGRTVAGFDVMLYAITVFAWSSSWIGLKFQTSSAVASDVSVAWRFGIASLLMFALAAARRQRLVFALADHLRFAVMGVLLFSVNFWLFYLGGHHLASGLLSVVFSLASIGNLLLGAAFLGQPVVARVALGALVGFAGICLIFWPEIAGAEFNHDALVGLGLCVAGTVCFCVGNLVSSGVQTRGLPVMSTTAWCMAYGALTMALLGLANGHDFALPAEASYLLSLLWLAVVSSVIAFASYLTLLGRIGAARAGYITVLLPIFALMISTVAEGYQWTAMAAAGLVAVIAGNVIVLARR